MSKLSDAELTRQLRRNMPLIGRTKPGQLRRLWPGVCEQWRTMDLNPPGLAIWPSLSVFAVMVILSFLSLTSFFSGTTPAIAAPGQIVPADIKATNTPFHTDEPGLTEPEATPGVAVSQTASAWNRAQPSPAPPPGIVVIRRGR
jgi:hypothetical protein